MTYGHLQADCLYTGISSGPNAWYRVWEAFTFYLTSSLLALENINDSKMWTLLCTTVGYVQQFSSFLLACNMETFFYPTIWYCGGILSLLSVILFLFTVTDFSAAEKCRGVKFCMRVRLSGQVFSRYGGQRSRSPGTKMRLALPTPTRVCE